MVCIDEQHQAFLLLYHSAIEVLMLIGQFQLQDKCILTRSF